MAAKSKDIKIWENCYSDSWKDLIVPEAFSHPAKFAPGLIRRIYEHGFKQGYWKKGDTILDPFGGISCGGIMAAPMGLNWIGVELEEKFVKLAIQNFHLHHMSFYALKKPMPFILQGDSRRLSEIIDGCDAICTSPPYAESLKTENKTDDLCPHDSSMRYERKYSPNPQNIGNLKAGDVDAVVTSPPWVDANHSKGWSEEYKEGFIKKHREKHPNRIGKENINLNDKYFEMPDTPGQIANLKPGTVDGVVTSPPYEDSLKTENKETDLCPHDSTMRYERKYSPDVSNIGNSKGETYWQAVAAVYSECHKILKPGGVICVVVKAYVKNGKRVDLPGQTWTLLQRIGFKPLERIRAMLVEEIPQQTMFGIPEKIKERKSFFRRLAEKKGSPRIDWEEVLILRKP